MTLLHPCGDQSICISCWVSKIPGGCQEMFPWFLDIALRDTTCRSITNQAPLSILARCILSYVELGNSCSELRVPNPFSEIS